MSLTRANIPGRSDVSELRTTARITIDRPAASNQRIDGRDTALERLARQRVSWTCNDWPTRTCLSVHFRHAEIDLERIDRFQSSPRRRLP